MSQDFYTFLGFTSNPFENNTAEREPDIATYAVRPPFLDRVQKSSYSKGIFVLTGSRGSGKSATRLTVAKTIWAQEEKPLVVPLIGFNIFRPFSQDGIPLELFANQVMFLTIENILSWLSAQSEQTAESVLGRLKSDDRALVRKLLSSFYLSRSENARKVSANECFATFDVSFVGKSGLWVEKRWDQVATVISNIASKLGEKYFEFDIGDPTAYAELLKRQTAEGFGDPLYVFGKAVELARLFGFTGIAIHIDKVDETDWTATDVVAGARLIYPLLANIQLHEIDGLTWSFFLWDKVTSQLNATSGFPVRWDKIPNGKIAWNHDYLYELIQRRLQHFSAGRVSSLGQICEKGMDEQVMVANLIALSEASPRHLISLLDVMLTEHIQGNPHAPVLLNPASRDQGMDIYSRRSLDNSGHTEIADQIAKVQVVRFTTRDVASRFGKGSQAARARIDAWVQTGLVRYDGSESGPLGGRPVDYFAVEDPRVQRVIERKL
ncbi:hypothetical protein LMG26858_00355 [Achromobacter anxifer]|uniref:Uncharacterized protein n=1 Tax=Achromobacter anxifer TaxID=1287737 RepID=A0A6S7DNM3_9BURK|nr:hypothetical protein [Achromobacter anxifer]CAB3824310.1 hypothetical protein LMG26858_00355 [Achromobacter anxifer]